MMTAYLGYDRDFADRRIASLVIAIAEARGVPVTGDLVTRILLDALTEDSLSEFEQDAKNVHPEKLSQEVLHQLTISGKASMIGENLWKAFSTPTWPESGERARLADQVTVDGYVIPAGAVGDVILLENRIQNMLIQEDDKRIVVFDGKFFPGAVILPMIFLERDDLPTGEIRTLCNEIWAGIGRGDTSAITGQLETILARDPSCANRMVGEMQNLCDHEARDLGACTVAADDSLARQAVADAEFVSRYLVTHGAHAPESSLPTTMAPSEPGASSKRWWRRR